MSETIRHILIGSILGDGFLTPLTKRAKLSRLWLKYDDGHYPYLEWLHQQLSPIGVDPIQKKKNYHQHYFLTRSLREIGILREQFYPNGKKIIPNGIDSLLVHPLSLAVWYMDDGNLDFRDAYHRNASFATYGFSKEGCRTLVEILERNFDIAARVHRTTMRNKVYFRTYILSQSTETFMALIRPYIHPCFAYKLREGNSQQSRQQPR